MGMRVEIQGTDRTTDVRLEGLSITRRVGAVGACELTLHSKTAAWRPALMESLEIWEPSRVVTDAAITSADKTLTSATAAFTSADVGSDVRIAEAGLGGYPLYATIASYTSGTSVELDLAASATKSSKQLVIGTCRFRGYLSEVPETRIGTAASTREWRCSAVDLVAATQKLWMPTTFTGASASLLSHLSSAVTACSEQAHGLRVVQTGGASSAWTQTPDWLYTIIDDSVTQNISETGTDKWWSVSRLGRVVVYAYNGWAYGGDDLSSGNANILLRPVTQRSGNEYWNSCTIAGAQESAGFYWYTTDTYQNTTEITALGGRTFDGPTFTLCDEFSGALSSNPNVPSWIETSSDFQTYGAAQQAGIGQSSWALIVDTLEEGIDAGMVVTVDVSELGISSVDHFVQQITSIWQPNSTWRHRLQANGQQVKYTTSWDRWRAWR